MENLLKTSPLKGCQQIVYIQVHPRSENCVSLIQGFLLYVVNLWKLCQIWSNSQWKITYLSFEEDPEPFGQVRDHNIKSMCKDMDVKVVTEKSHTLYDLDSIIDKNLGKSPSTYKQFINTISKMKPPTTPVPHVNVKVKNCGVSLHQSRMIMTNFGEYWV